MNKLLTTDNWQPTSDNRQQIADNLKGNPNIQVSLATDNRQLTPAMITIFPNPVQSGTSINIVCENFTSDNYFIRIYNVEGQRVMSAQSWIDGETQVLNLTIPMLPGGVYEVRVMGRRTGKKVVERLTLKV